MYRSKKKSIYNYLPIFFTIIFYIQIYAGYQSDSTIGNLLLREKMRLFQYCEIIIILGCIMRKKYITINKILLIMMCLIFTIIPIVNRYSGKIGGMLLFLILVTFFLSDNKVQYKTFIYCKKGWLLCSIIGIICFVVYLFKIPIPYTEHEYYSRILENVGVFRYYINYKICFLYKEGTIIRLCGICNEPGYFGTISALFLCADNINLKKIENICIFIAGCLTISLAFFILLILYTILSSCKNKKIFLLILLGIFIYIFIIPNISTGNEAIDYTLRRIQISNGKLIGDNRNRNDVEILLETTLNNKILWGFGGGYTSSNAENFSTYKAYIIDYGILGFIMMYGSLFICTIWIYCRKNFLSIIYILVFFASIYQRPNIFNLQYMLLLFGGLAYISKN